jgi:hypothetical protein
MTKLEELVEKAVKVSMDATFQITASEITEKYVRVLLTDLDFTNSVKKAILKALNELQTESESNG